MSQRPSTPPGFLAAFLEQYIGQARHMIEAISHLEQSAQKAALEGDLENAKNSSEGFLAKAAICLTIAGAIDGIQENKLTTTATASFLKGCAPNKTVLGHNTEKQVDTLNDEINPPSPTPAGL